MIARAWFKDFKRLRDVSLDLGRLNVIVGPNGVGKSTVLEGLHLLLQLATEQRGERSLSTGRPGVLFTGRRSVERVASRPDASAFELDVETDDKVPFGLLATTGSQSEGSGEGSDPSPSFELRFGAGAAASSIQLPGCEASEQATFFAGPSEHHLGEVVRLKLHAETLEAHHYSEEDEPQIEYDGTGLASVLQHVQGLRDGTLEAIETDLSSVVPGAKRVRALLTKVPLTERVRVTVNGQESWHEQRREVTGARFEVEFDRIGWIRSGQLSEGTLLALGLLTRLHYCPPRMVLLDDLDQALHPVAQRELIDLIRQILDAKPDVQIVAASHSPFVLDALDGTEVFIAGAIDDAASRVVRLDAHPAWEERKGFMHPGEFWSAVGEGWVVEPAK